MMEKMRRADNGDKHAPPRDTPSAAPGAEGNSVPSESAPNDAGSPPAASPGWKREQRSTGPRRVRKGIRLASTEEGLLADSRAGGWVSLARTIAGPAEYAEGLAYALQGQVVMLAFEPLEVVADVQGSRRRPYRVTIRPCAWTPAEWSRLVELVAAQAGMAANLLNSELSEEAFRALEQADAGAIPKTGDAVATTCECVAGGACRHVVAAILLAAQALMREPLHIFLLRGEPIDAVLERVRRHRVIQTRGIAAAHPDPIIDAARIPAPALEAMIDSFWSPPADLEESHVATGAAHVPHALLRRLGPSPLKGRFPIVGLLASVYDEVSTHARRLVDAVGAGNGEEKEAEDESIS